MSLFANLLAYAPGCFGDSSVAGWTTDLSITAPLLVFLLLYAVGVARLWRTAGIGRGAPAWQVASFAAGWLALAVALVSPLHELSEQLFTAHMVEHELLMVVAAPLLVLARPLGPMLWAVPAGWRSSTARGVQVAAYLLGWDILTLPFMAALLHAAAIWIWHIPALFQLALLVEWVHWLQHLSFLVTALFFWWVVVHGRDRARSYGTGIFLLFATAAHTSFLGVLIALTPQVIYPIQTEVALRYGLTPLEDQQLAGLIMWVPPGAVYAIVALALAGLWVARSSRAAGRAPEVLDAR